MDCCSSFHGSSVCLSVCKDLLKKLILSRLIVWVYKYLDIKAGFSPHSRCLDLSSLSLIAKRNCLLIQKTYIKRPHQNPEWFMLFFDDLYYLKISWFWKWKQWFFISSLIFVIYIFSFSLSNMTCIDHYEFLAFYLYIMRYKFLKEGTSTYIQQNCGNINRSCLH